jgi:hypothetical protein
MDDYALDDMDYLQRNVKALGQGKLSIIASDFAVDLSYRFLIRLASRSRGSVFCFRSPFSSSTEVVKKASFWLRSDSF